jgi:hypothetical protein
LQLLKGYTSASATVGGFKLDLANTSVGAPELAFYSGTSIGNTAASFVEPTWTERARIDSTGRLGLGTSTPNSPFEVGTLGINFDGAIAALPSSGADSAAFIARTASTGSAPFDQAGSIIYRPRVSSTAGRSSHIFYTGSPSAIRMVINEAGNVGIGVTGPQALLHCETTGQELARFNSSNVNGGYLSVQSSGTNVIYIGSAATLSSGTSTQGTVRTQSDLLFATGGGSERARIDSSGRLLIGTSTSPTQPQGQYAILVAQGYAGVPTAEGIVSIQRGQGAASITSGADIGRLVFGDSAGNTFAGMYCYADANAGSGDYPGRLVFSTTADGASSPTERMRIAQNGVITAQGVYDFTTANAANVAVLSAGQIYRSTSSSKYKTDIETLEDSYSEALLECRPVWYRSTCESDNPSHSWWGFIAEEVAEIDPRLVHWKTTEPVVQENGSIENVSCDPEPEGVAYDRFVPHLLNLIKRQKEQIDAMEARLAALEAS